VIIHDGDPQSFLRHFHTDQEHMVIALLVLSLDSREKDAIQEMLDRVPQIDELLGEEIGLYFFGPMPEAGLLNRGAMGRTEVMAGEALSPGRRHSQTTAVRDFFENLSSSDLGEDAHRSLRAQIARRTIDIVPDFCRVLGLEVRDLPVICAIVRGSDQLVTAKIRSDDVLARVIEATRLLDREVAAVRMQLEMIVNGADAIERQLGKAERSTTKSDKLAA
jgi:hypothetical protein